MYVGPYIIAWADGKKILIRIGINGSKYLNTKTLFSKEFEFQARHIGPREHDQRQMLDELGFKVCHHFCNVTMIYNILILCQ